MTSARSVTSTRSVTLLGSTGSIGTQAVEVIRANPDRFTVVALSAGGGRLDVLAEQAVQLEVEVVGLATDDPATLDAFADRLRSAAAAAGRIGATPEIVSGPKAAEQIAAAGADVVLNGITGSIGLAPTLAALSAGSTLALANKESLIVGGDLVTSIAAPGQIVPVDSEHSAIAQCLPAGRREDVRRLVITASGGPFRGRSREQLRSVTPEQALVHPNFAMGKVITTNSATLVNKGLEVIEAHLLFGVSFDDITVVVHPQQQIHSMVEFRDGSTIAQAGPPRMLVPIALGLSWPERLDSVDLPCDWSAASTWDFAPLDESAFPAVPLAYQVGRAGGTYPAVYNAANEECVEAFHAGEVGFLGIVDVIECVVQDWADSPQNQSAARSVEDVLSAEKWARQRAHELLGSADEAVVQKVGTQL